MSDGADGTGAWAAVTMVARREITTRTRSKTFLISTGVMLVSIIVGVVAMRLFGGGATSVAVTDPAMARPLQVAAKSLGEDVKVRTVPDEAAGTRQVADGKLDVLVAGSATAPRLVVQREAAAPLRAAVAGIARQAVLNREITRTGGDPAAVARAVSSVQVQVRTLDPQAAGYGERVGISMFAGFLVYLTLLVYGQQVAQGVIEEKASRIVELLLSAIRPWQLMLGKVLGIGAVGLFQVLVILGVGVGAAQSAGTFTISSSIVTGMAAWALVWFLVGFLMYALMFAAGGALVSRQEEASSVVTPITMLLVVPYIVGVTVLPGNPDSAMATALSLVPVFSPALMPMRMAYGAPAWQVAVSLGLSVLLIGVLVWLTGRVYRNAVLRTGTRVRLTAALRNT